MPTHTTKYTFGDIVYLITDCEQEERMVTDIKISPGPQVVYCLTCGTAHTEHYEMEISSRRDINKAMGINGGEVIK
ncbi:MAG: hypothetical protein Q8R83_06035 [Legionellaceae bacterium]|nr:hypothetical protein [Legionellaceae bacterium]